METTTIELIDGPFDGVEFEVLGDDWPDTANQFVSLSFDVPIAFDDELVTVVRRSTYQLIDIVSPLAERIGYLYRGSRDIRPDEPVERIG
jgi:hypothetical protein